jgi:hypothetical protein
MSSIKVEASSSEEEMTFEEFVESHMKKRLITAIINRPLTDGEAMVIIHLLKMKKDTK